jgi:phospholipase/carboxylesterase
MIDISKFDFSLLPPALLGRLSFAHAPPKNPPLESGRNHLGIAAERDAVLYVPSGLDPGVELPLLVMFHGANGSAEGMLPWFEEHAERERFLVLALQSLFPTWDLVMGGNGPDLERLERALGKVATHYLLDPKRFAFAGFSDGGSYALSVGLANGRLVSHVIAFSAGFINLYLPQGVPSVLIAHGNQDEQLPAESHGRAHAARLKADGYRVEYIEFDGRHKMEPEVVSRAVEFLIGPKASIS